MVVVASFSPTNSTSPQLENQLTVDEVAKAFGVTARTIFRWVDIGHFPPPIKFGHTVRWPLSAVRRHLDSRHAECLSRLEKGGDEAR